MSLKNVCSRNAEMTTIILDDEQAKSLKASHQAELRDRSGNLIGRALSPETEEDLRIIRERAANPGKTYTTAEVWEHLKSLRTP
jgi:hypothetical protein